MKLNSAKQAHPGLARIWMIESGNWCTKVKIGWIYVNFFAPNENWLADKWNWLPRTKISVPVNEFVCSDSKFEWPNRRASGKCVNLNAHTWIWMRKWWNWPGKPILTLCPLHWLAEHTAGCQLRLKSQFIHNTHGTHLNLLYAHTHNSNACIALYTHPPSLHRFRRHCLHWDFQSFWNCFCHQSIKRQEVYSEVSRVNFNRRLVHCRLTLYLKPHFNPKLPRSLLPLARLLISLQ